MTAMNAFVRDDAAYLIADTAFYHHDGRVLAFGEKVVTDARLGIMIGICGRTGEEDADRIEQWLADQPDQLTAFARLSALLCVLADDATGADCFDSGPIPEGIRLTVAWWAPFNNKGRCAIIASTPELAGGAEPFELRQLRSLFMPALGELDPWPGHSFDPDADVAALADYQRRAGHDDGKPRVGGQMILYRVDPNGITSREICRWPDRIGRPIMVAA